jgi:ABC-type lipoprotein release transport system permease subunit
MSKRLQVLLEESDLAEIRRLAQRLDMTVAEWVRLALHEARRQTPRKSATRKLEAIREAVKFGFPTSDIRTMLAEIERGYGVESESR